MCNPVVVNVTQALLALLDEQVCFCLKTQRSGSIWLPSLSGVSSEFVSLLLTYRQVELRFVLVLFGFCHWWYRGPTRRGAASVINEA
jgi:hypothetical protein